jgi:DNA-binding response OmpR family regulator
MRIIAISGLPDEDVHRQRALEAGCQEFYKKPLDPATLERLLSKQFSEAVPTGKQDRIP